jgi:hypothetical protein
VALARAPRTLPRRVQRRHREGAGPLRVEYRPCAGGHARGLPLRGRAAKCLRPLDMRALGFWVHLTDRSRETAIWRTCLYRAWPKGTRRKEFQHLLNGILRVRNRAAHTERLFNPAEAELSSLSAVSAALKLLGGVSRSRQAAVWRRRDDAHRALLRGAPCTCRCETVGDRDAGVSCAPSSCLCDGSRESAARGAIDTRGGDSSDKMFETGAGDGGQGHPPQDGWPCHWRHHLRAGNPCVHFLRMDWGSKKTGCSASREGRKGSSLFLAASR